MKQRKSTEDYLKIIYNLGKMGDEVRGSRIAEELGVSRPTVSVSLKALEKEGYITMDETHAVHLTELGSTVAEETYERHMTFQQLLEGLGVSRDTASADACEMEHVVSPESYVALKQLAAQRHKEKNSHDL